MNLRSDPDRYWDFVLGSDAFKRSDGNRTSEESTSGNEPVRHFPTSGQTRRPVFDVPGRKLKSADGVAAAKDEDSEHLQEAKKRLGDDFYDFLLGEHGR